MGLIKVIHSRYLRKKVCKVAPVYGRSKANQYIHLLFVTKTDNNNKNTRKMDTKKTEIKQYTMQAVAPTQMQ